MKAILVSLFFDEAKTPIIDGAIAAILLAFSVVVGVALERLLTTEARKIAARDGGKHREVLYWLVLIIGVTLSIRFLVGSYVHLHMTYSAVPKLADFFCLLKDLVFLFAFGAFLVRMSLSDTSEEFLKWILIFSYADILWCVTELLVRFKEPGARIAWGWLGIGVVQLVIVMFARRSLALQETASQDTPSRNFHIFIFLAIVFLIIFGVDLWVILIHSPWKEFLSHPC